MVRLPCGRHNSAQNGTGKCVTWGVLESQDEAERRCQRETVFAWDVYMHRRRFRKRHSSNYTIAMMSCKFGLQLYALWVSRSPLHYGEACPSATPTSQPTSEDPLEYLYYDHPTALKLSINKSHILLLSRISQRQRIYPQPVNINFLALAKLSIHYQSIDIKLQPTGKDLE